MTNRKDFGIWILTFGIHSVCVKSSSCFSAKITCINILLKERAGAVFGIPKTLIKHLHDGQACVQANEVCQCQRSHGMIHP